MEEFLDRRKMTEFGSLSMVDEGAGDGDGVEVSLPGVRRGDMSSRHFKPEIRVSSLHFSPIVPVVCSTLPDVYVEKLLAFVGATLENSRHLQFYLTWAQSLLTIHGQKLKNRSGAILPTIQSLQKSIQRHHDDLSKLCDWNIYALRYAVALSNQRGLKRAAADELSEEEEGSEEEDDLMSEPLMTESDLLS
ncbi:periodic tryptophan protein 2 homolog [Alosa sapidissima]|uniref:periodic tryptophan protein 2 homolog n=1 Tax=Alosa sapidissima TaxID=34773 RepID=UPI001C08D4C9|nr:periodic tryptophan protein 2 homolog [Alosa sapidissima]